MWTLILSMGTCRCRISRIVLLGNAVSELKQSCRWPRKGNTTTNNKPKIKASPHAGTNTTSSRSLTWVTQNADFMAVSTRPLTIWSLAALNWLKLNTSTATTRQLHTCTGRSAKSLVLRWGNDGMSMNPRLSPRRIASWFCETCPSTLTGPLQLIGQTL